MISIFKNFVVYSVTLSNSIKNQYYNNNPLANQKKIANNNQSFNSKLYAFDTIQVSYFLFPCLSKSL